jgi:hypothetical protein
LVARAGKPVCRHAVVPPPVVGKLEGVLSRAYVAGIDDGTAVPWNLTELYALRDGAVDRACSLVGGGLDRDEWSRYVSGLPYETTCPRGP